MTTYMRISLLHKHMYSAPLVSEWAREVRLSFRYADAATTMSLDDVGFLPVGLKQAIKTDFGLNFEHQF